MNAISPRPRLIVVGNGMAGIRTVQEILDRAPAAFRITVFGAEPHGNYNRIMLSRCSPARSASRRSSPTTAPGTTRTTSS
jgi:NAD(P)H-nitrite reductase large subunit